MAEEDMTLAEKWWANLSVVSDIEEGIIKGGLDDFDHIGTDDYDASIEIYGVAPDARVTQATSDFLAECGFVKIYVNHKDGWETHYSTGSIYGWRRRYVSDPTVATTNVIAGPENNGYFEVSYFPDGFPKGWLETGYMRVVPDPLMPEKPIPDQTETQAISSD